MQELHFTHAHFAMETLLTSMMLPNIWAYSLLVALMLQNLPFLFRRFRPVVCVFALRAAAALTACALRHALLTRASHHCGGDVAVKRIVRISRIRDHVPHLLLKVGNSIQSIIVHVKKKFCFRSIGGYSSFQQSSKSATYSIFNRILINILISRFFVYFINNNVLPHENPDISRVFGEVTNRTKTYNYKWSSFNHI